MKTIEVVFDGKAFVPKQPVDLPAGTTGNVVCPDHGYPGPPAGIPGSVQTLTPEQQAIWQDLMRSARTARPDPPTFDEYLRQQRGDS